MKQISTHGSKVFGILLIAFMVSCGQSGKKQEENTQTKTQEKEQEAPVTKTEAPKQEKVHYVLPSPLQIASIFKKSGLEYQSGVTNDVSKSSQYTSRFSKSLNFGVYSADLSYCVLNNQPQEAMKYMKTVRQMSQGLGLEKVFQSEDLFNSFEKNIGNQDSMVSILVDIQENMDMYLHENNREHLSPVFFAGAWLEGMYIGASTTKEPTHDLALRLVEQMTILENLIRALKQAPDQGAEQKTFISKLEGIYNTFKEFDSVKNMGEDEYSLDKYELSKEEFDKIGKMITELRNETVSP